MAVIRPAVALDPRRFGRGPILCAEPLSARPRKRPSALAKDLRLFAITFAAGFLFVTVWIG
ncbi:MAG: hypothetical protein ABI422_05255 [Sphingomicrobium sp.]